MKKTMRPRHVEANPKYSYDEKGARHYRDSEEKSIQYGSRKHYCGILKDVSASFERKISALDVGCGTGRYFHCLQNVERLLGLDISQSMLDQAVNPVKKDEIQIGDISLSCADIFEVSLPPESYDLIFSIGVLGKDAPFNLQICNKLHGLLTRRGQLFITIADIHSRFQRLHSVSPVLKRAFLRRTLSLCPPKIREKLNKKHDSLYMTKNEVALILQQSAFSSFRLERYLHPPDLAGKGLISIVGPTRNNRISPRRGTAGSPRPTLALTCGNPGRNHLTRRLRKVKIEAALPGFFGDGRDAISKKLLPI